MEEAKLQHAYAAHVYSFGVSEETGLFWVATELVHGVTLDQWLAQHGPMPPDQFVPFFVCVALAVQAAHDRGIVHRALKPSKVMVLESAGRLCPKLLGFGLDQLTSSDAGTGSQAADIHALGAIAYEILAGVPVTSDAPVPPLGGDFSPDLDPVLQRALARSPEDRHGTALELASELCAALRRSPREQIRSAAQQWDDGGRAPGLLLGPDVLANAPSKGLSELVCSFIAASQRRVRRVRRARRSLVAVAAIVAVGVSWYVSVTQAHMAAQRAEHQTQLAQEEARATQRVMDATTTRDEREQGRAALLHGEPEAQVHLGRAYERGDHSPGTEFMYDRALQPKLAELTRFPSLSGRMWWAAFSSDGRQIVTTDDRGAQVWDAQNYRLLFKLPHGSEVYQAAYSTDGARLLTAAKDAIRIWDATRGALVHKLPPMRNDSAPPDYFVMALSSDGRLVSAIDAAGAEVHVWDTTTGAPLAKLRADAMDFPGLAFSADGHWLAVTGGNDVRVFDTRTWRLTLTLRGPRIHSLAFDPTGPRLLTGAATGDAAIWVIPSGVQSQSLRGKGDPVDAVAFSPDGQLAITASRDGTAQVWHARSGELQSHFNPRHSKIHAVEFDRTSRLVLAAGTDGTVVVADAMQGTLVTELEGPKNIVSAAHFDPSSRRIVGASWDGTARVWDATSPYRQWSSPPVSDDCGIITSPEADTRFIAIGCREHTTRVWDTLRDQLLAELPSVSHIDGDFTSAFPEVSRAGDRAAITRGKGVEVYELPGGRLLRTIAHDAPVNAVAFGGAERDIVSGAINGALFVTHDDGTQLVLPPSSGGIDAVAFLPDGRVIAADSQRRLQVYDRSGTILAALEIPMRVMSLRIEGIRLVTVPLYSGSAAPPLVLDLEHYRVIARLEGHVGAVYSARWVSGNQILTAGGDGTAKLWDGATGQLRQTYQGSSRFLIDATLTPAGMVIAGGADGLLRFWDAESGRLLWMLRAHTSQLIGVHVEGDDIVTRGFSGELSRWRLPSSEQVIRACSDHDRCKILQQSSTK
jgi:WD40 repeat protein